MSSNHPEPTVVRRELALALTEQTPAADSGTLMHAIVVRWGGIEAIANDLYIEFQAAAPGSMTRKSILELFQRLVIHTTQVGIEREIRPADMDDQDLENELCDYTARTIKRLEQKALELDAAQSSPPKVPQPNLPEAPHPVPASEWNQLTPTSYSYKRR